MARCQNLAAGLRDQWMNIDVFFHFDVEKRGAGRQSPPFHSFRKHAQLIGKGSKKLVRQIRVEIADPSGTNLDVVEKIRPAAQIDDYLRQRFIEGTARLTEAADAMPLARFLCCDFSSWQDITIPVGMCVMRTAESVVLTL